MFAGSALDVLLVTALLARTTSRPGLRIDHHAVAFGSSPTIGTHHALRTSFQKSTELLLVTTLTGIQRRGQRCLLLEFPHRCLSESLLWLLLHLRPS